MSANEHGVALALDAFLAEHARCWKLTGQDMQTHEDDAVVRVLCPGCGASVTVSKQR
jgi:hypothetical protein